MTQNHSLTALNISRLHPVELTQFVHRFFTDMADKGQNWADDSDIENQVAVVKESLANLEEAIKLDQKNSGTKPFTQALKAADRERDSAFIALRRLLKVYEFNQQPKEQKAYQELNALFSQYKDINTANYEKASAQTNYLISKLSKEPYAELAASLNMTPFIEDLKIKQQGFEAVFAQKSQSSMVTVKTDTLTSFSQKLQSDYKDLANYILLKTRLRKTEDYQNILMILNNSRKYYRDMLARRGSRKKEAVLASESTDAV
ncbi:DUF6261 family protein [Streptococcus dentiloxodontae]